MKKLSIFLAVVFMVTILDGCGGSNFPDSKAPVLRVCVNDLNSSLYATVETIARAFREAYPGVEIQLEALSTDLKDEAETQKIRTDIMAGKGPDVFIMQSRGYEAYEPEPNYLFPNVNKAMESGVFCNLDDYIKKDDFWEKGNIPKEFLKAGTYNGRQYVLPITIDFPMLVQDKSKKVDVSSEKTLMDCIEKIAECKNQNALAEMNYYCFTSRFQLLENALDYDNQEVLFNKTTFMELGKYLSEIALQRRIEEQEDEHNESSNRSGFCTWVTRSFGEENLDYQVLPTTMGKRTAFIQSYGAVSASSKEKQTAYDFLRFFLETERQGKQDSSGCYSNSSIEIGREYPVNREGFEHFLSNTPAKEELLRCFDSLEDCVFLSQASRLAGERIRELQSRIIAGETPFTEKELEVFADEIYKKYKMVLKE